MLKIKILLPSNVLFINRHNYLTIRRMQTNPHPPNPRRKLRFFFFKPSASVQTYLREMMCYWPITLDRHFVIHSPFMNIRECNPMRRKNKKTFLAPRKSNIIDMYNRLISPSIINLYSNMIEINQKHPGSITRSSMIENHE